MEMTHSPINCILSKGPDRYCKSFQTKGRLVWKTGYDQLLALLRNGRQSISFFPIMPYFLI